MPTANGAKHKSVMMGAPGAQSSSPTAQQKKTFPGTGPSLQTQAPAHLRIPHQPRRPTPTRWHHMVVSTKGLPNLLHPTAWETFASRCLLLKPQLSHWVVLPHPWTARKRSAGFLRSTNIMHSWFTMCLTNLYKLRVNARIFFVLSFYHFLVRSVFVEHVRVKLPRIHLKC